MAGRGLLLLALGLGLGVVAVQLFHHWHKPGLEQPPVHYTLPPAEDCDAAREVCTTARDGVRVALQLNGRVQGLTPFQTQVVLAGLDADEVVLSFVMRDMEMGRNNYRMLRQGNGWVASVTLPLCTTGRSDWWVRVQLRERGAEWLAEFPFSLGGQ